MCNKLNCWALLPFWPDYWTIILCLLSDLQLSEKDKPYVDIQGLTASTMEILLDFVYTETVHVTVENVQELLPAACLLQLKGNCQESAETAQLVEELTCLEKKMIKYYFSMVWATLYLHENTQEEFNVIISKSLISLGLAITMCLDHNNLVDVCVWSYPRHLSKRHWRKP